MKSKIENNKLVLADGQSFDLTGGLDLRNTPITQLPDGLHVGGAIFKDF